MSLGNTISLDYVTTSDPITGAPVTRISHTEDLFHPYFTQPLFVDEEMLLTSYVQSGIAQCGLIDLKSKKLINLSDEPTGISEHYSTVLSGRRQVCYWAQRKLKRIFVDNFDIETILEVPQGFYPMCCSSSSDGRYMAATYSELPSGATDMGGDLVGKLMDSKCLKIDSVGERSFRRPHSVLFRIDFDLGKVEVVWGENNRIGHVSISPIDSDLLLFCYELPRSQRMFTLNLKKHQRRPDRLYDQEATKDSVGHEFFLANGRIAAVGHDGETGRGFNLVLNADNTEVCKYWYPSKCAHHIQADPTSELFVGDSGHMVPDDAEGEQWIALITHQGQEAVIQRLCKHGSVFNIQRGHPHPFFSPDGKWVFFSSCRQGQVAIYRTPSEVGR